MNIVSWIIQRAKNFGNKFSGLFSNKYSVIYTGTIVKMAYSNYKHDPAPLILVLYSGVKYTHALNLNYLSTQEKQYLMRLIYALKKGNQPVNTRAVYMLLKRDVYYSIVRKSYRTYFSNMILNPRVVSNGWTSFGLKTQYINDPFVINLNKYLGMQATNVIQSRVSYYPQELQEQIIQSINSVPVGRGTTPATRPTIQSTTPATTQTRKDIT